MGKAYWYIALIDGVEPVLCGPFDTDEARDLAARERRNSSKGDDIVISLDACDCMIPVVDAYTAGWMDEGRQ